MNYLNRLMTWYAKLLVLAINIKICYNQLKTV